jgi:ABC-2 type transport system ATP-binding protein
MNEPADSTRDDRTEPDETVDDPSEDEGRDGSGVARTGGEPIVIAARRLSYWYGDVIGINEISLDIGPGVTGLLGPNGAGKSTLLKVMTGQLEPTTGAVAIKGESVWNNAGIRTEIGLVPEQDSFYEEMSGREFVTYLTRLQGFDADRAGELADEAIETVGLTDDRDRAIREYSKGMRQRIKMAQALAHRPDVLFLDEPLNGTDPVGRHEMIELIQQLGDEGHTVVVSSHVLEEVEQMTSDILLIDKGRVLADGNIYQIRNMIDEHPHTIFIDCDQPRSFAAALAAYEDVVSIEFVSNGFHVATDDPNACYSRIPELALERDVHLRGMTSPDNDLSAVFRYLVE